MAFVPLAAETILLAPKIPSSASLHFILMPSKMFACFMKEDRDET
jgi:hypothetical protein